ncbi:MAG: M23 family metallopeptidase [Gemmatimonadota bacterium]
MRDRVGAIGTAGIVLLLAGACSPRVEPGTPERGQAAVPQPARGAEPEPADSLHVAAETPDSLSARIEPVLLDGAAAEPIPVPILPAGLLWSPAEPEEGSAFGIRILQPAGGQRVTSVEGWIADRPLNFALLADRWFAMASVPVGTSGTETLSVTATYADGSQMDQEITIRSRPREFASRQLSVAPRFSSPPPETQARIARERERVQALLADVTPEWFLESDFEPPRPVQVTSPFGQRRVFNGELRSRHWGLDLSGQTGAPIVAAGRGRVRLAENLYFAGNAVYVDHGSGVFTAYFHLSAFDVREGEMVEAGQLIGRAGDTGRVTGAHLHWSAYVAGLPLDASSFLAIEVPGG